VAIGTSSLLCKNEYFKLAVSSCKGILEVAKNLPFAKPLAGAVIMFYETYELYQKNKEMFKELFEEVNEAKLWIIEVGKRKITFDSQGVLETTFHKLVSEVYEAQKWMKGVSVRYNSKTESTAAAASNIMRNFVLSQADQDEMTALMTKIRNDVVKFPTFLSGITALDKITHGLTSTKNELKIATFQNQIALLCNKFLPGARQWIFTLVSDWLQSKSVDDSGNLMSRLFWIQADAGMGKSVVAAMIATKHQDMIIGTVFFNFTDVSLSNPETIIRSLAFQIAEKYPLVQDEIIYFLRSQQNENVACSLPTLLESVLLKPLLRLSREGIFASGCLMVLDAVDECILGEKRIELLRFLANQLLKKLPSNVKFLITSRPEPDIVDALADFRPCEIKENDERHQADLRKFIKAILTEYQLFEEEDLFDEAVERLYEKSEGKFVYASLVGEEIKGWKRLPKKGDRMTRLLSLPKGIDGKFCEFLKACNLRTKNFCQLW
jgi:hypothetical protein